MMKNLIKTILLSVLILQAVQCHAAYDVIPSGCISMCENGTECLSSVGWCEAYLSNYSDIKLVRDAILRRVELNISDPGYNNRSVRYLENSWCLACCKYGFTGNATHPCIFPCPCKVNESNVTVTTFFGEDKRPPFWDSIKSVISLTNWALCLFLNFLWMVIPAISSLVIVYSGFKYIVSASDAAERQRSKSMIVYSLFGLTFAIVACPAVDYIIDGTDITPFEESCKCYELMDSRNASEPEMPDIPNITVKYTNITLRVVESRATTTTTTSSTTSTTVVTKLTIVFVPVDWTSGDAAFNSAADAQAREIIKNIPLKDCPGAVKIIKVNQSCHVGYTSSGSSCTCPKLNIIENCAKSAGVRNYDYVVGLEDSDVCGTTLGYSCVSGTVFSERSHTIVAVHELGHEWRLNDEYVDACNCGYALSRANCLDRALDGDDPAGGYTSAYCTGGSCAGYTITCLGNKNPQGGRCIMSYGNAPSPRVFCEHCWDHLSTIPKLKC